jgi:hypothetical protein
MSDEFLMQNRPRGTGETKAMKTCCHACEHALMADQTRRFDFHSRSTGGFAVSRLSVH